MLLQGNQANEWAHISPRALLPDSIGLTHARERCPPRSFLEKYVDSAIRRSGLHLKLAVVAKGEGACPFWGVRLGRDGVGAGEGIVGLVQYARFRRLPHGVQWGGAWRGDRGDRLGGARRATLCMVGDFKLSRWVCAPVATLTTALHP